MHVVILIDGPIAENYTKHGQIGCVKLKRKRDVSGKVIVAPPVIVRGKFSIETLDRK